MNSGGYYKKKRSSKSQKGKEVWSYGD